MSENEREIDTGSVPQIMSTPPTPTTKPRQRERDTGFPEPFSDISNTRLPHPDADLSPNAFISDDPLTATESVTRRRASMLSKHRRTISQASTLSKQTPVIMPPAVITNLANPEPPTASSVAPSSSQGPRFSAESFAAQEDTPPTSPDTPSAQHKRRSFLGRFKRR